MIWRDIEKIARIKRGKLTSDVSIPKTEIAHPRESGFRKSIGLWRGQTSDWRRLTSDGGCLHVLEYNNKYAAHFDKVDPIESPSGHFVYDVIPYLFKLLVLLALVVLAVLIG